MKSIIQLFVDMFIRLIVHIAMAYVFTFWTCYILYKEYKIVTNMRLHFLASENRRPDQYTVSFWVVNTIYVFLKKLVFYIFFFYNFCFMCRFLWEMSPQIQMKLLVNMLSISSLLIIPINILYIRFASFLKNI